MPRSYVAAARAESTSSPSSIAALERAVLDLHGVITRAGDRRTLSRPADRRARARRRRPRPSPGSTPGSSTTTCRTGGSSVRKQSHCGRKPWRSPAKPGTCHRSAKSSWISPWRSSSRFARSCSRTRSGLPLKHGTSDRANRAFAGSVASTPGSRPFGISRGSSAEARASTARQALRRRVDHLAADARAVRGRDDLPRPLDLLRRRREHLVHRRDLAGWITHLPS